MKENNTYNLKRDSEGNILFDVSVKDKTQILSSYTVNQTEWINSEFTNLLDTVASSIPSKENIHLNLNCGQISESEKNVYKNAIKSYFNRRLMENTRKLKTNLFVFIVMVALSVVMMSVLFVAHFLNFTWLVTEVLDIVAWVFVWASVETVAFERSKLIYIKHKYTALYDSKITFNE